MRTFGSDMEAAAAKYLATSRGWQLLERNVHFREGELDLIMLGKDGLKFVEVKARRNEKFGGVVESLTTQKVQRLRRAIYRWRMARSDHRPGELWFVGILVEAGKPPRMEEHLIE